MTNIDLPDSWKSHLSDELKKPYFKAINYFLEQETKSGKIIYPAPENIFRAFKLTSFDSVKVVILGQDPYHGEGQAEGLSFSVPKSQKLPPSLRNIYKEIETDLGIKSPEHGNLITWAQQGVLLLNSTLTVEHKKPNSHSEIGWGIFTDKVIETLSEKRENLVFMLWGKFSQHKSSLIDSAKHLILEAPHPSPFSAHKGFLGCRHFSQTNAYLIQHKQETINW